MTETSINPAIFTWDGPHGLPRFEAVKDYQVRDKAA